MILFFLYASCFLTGDEQKLCPNCGYFSKFSGNLVPKYCVGAVTFPKLKQHYQQIVPKICQVALKIFFKNQFSANISHMYTHFLGAKAPLGLALVIN